MAHLNEELIRNLLGDLGILLVSRYNVQRFHVLDSDVVPLDSVKLFQVILVKLLALQTYCELVGD